MPAKMPANALFGRGVAFSAIATPPSLLSKRATAVGKALMNSFAMNTCGGGRFAAMMLAVPSSLLAQPCLPDIDGDGQPLFSTPVSLTAPCADPTGNDCAKATAVAIADLNGDGHLDMAVGHTNETPIGGFTILLNSGDGVYAPSVFHKLNSRIADLVATDADFDGDMDLAMVDFDEDAIRLIGEEDRELALTLSTLRAAIGLRSRARPSPRRCELPAPTAAS